MIGHGLRERQVRGPAVIGGRPVTRAISARRYRCRRCSAILVVVPRGVVGRRHFSAIAIGLALFVYGKLRATAAATGERIGLWGRGAGAWKTIRRWIGAVDAGELFPYVRDSPSGWPPRRRAERAAMTIVARAPSTSGQSEEARVFAGAAMTT